VTVLLAARVHQELTAASSCVILPASLRISISTSLRNCAAFTVLSAKVAAGEQRAPGETVGIEYETKDGVWHEELDPGSDRPQTSVEDEE
jgi:hypothetical protein